MGCFFGHTVMDKKYYLRQKRQSLHKKILVLTLLSLLMNYLRTTLISKSSLILLKEHTVGKNARLMHICKYPIIKQCMQLFMGESIKNYEHAVVITSHSYTLM